MPNRIWKLTPLVALLCAGCASIVTTPPADCLAFIPESWKKPIEAAPLPAGNDLPAWVTFGVEQSGQLQKSTDRTADVLHIIGQCEANANKARPRRKVLGVF